MHMTYMTSDQRFEGPKRTKHAKGQNDEQGVHGRRAKNEAPRASNLGKFVDAVMPSLPAGSSGACWHGVEGDGWFSMREWIHIAADESSLPFVLF
jgi:hypothetical protein